MSNIENSDIEKINFFIKIEQVIFSNTKNIVTMKFFKIASYNNPNKKIFIYC